MKKLIFLILILFVINVLFAAALSQDFYVRQVFNLSQHLSNPQAIEVIPGGFVIIDWKGNSSFAYKLDADGVLLNETNSSGGRAAAEFNLTSNFSAQITGIRSFNLTGNDATYVLIDNTAKKVFRANASNFANYSAQLWFLPSPGAFASDDDLSGLCTNGTYIWVSLKNRDVINTFSSGNSSFNNTGEYRIPFTSSAGGLDCFNGNTSNLFILEDTTSLLYISENSSDESKFLEKINLSNVTRETNFNSFSDIAFRSLYDFYVLNNASKVIYHINKREGLNIFSPNMTFSNPSALQSFSSRLSSSSVQFNLSAVQGNITLENGTRPYSVFTPADRLNCSLYINSTFNTSAFVVNNLSQYYFFNISFQPGYYRSEIKCKANITYAAEGSAGFKEFSVRTFKHVFWINDNFTLIYNSDNSRFEAFLGNRSAAMSIPYNITSNEPISIKVIWNNETQNRSVYINGEMKSSDLEYYWKQAKNDRIYLGSRNDTGQLNGIIVFFQTTNKAAESRYREGSFSSSWIQNNKDLHELMKSSSYFFRYKVVLRRSLSSDQPILKFLNISFDETLLNLSLPKGISFLDFKFPSSSSSATPAGQSATQPIYSIWNTGNVSFALRAFSLTPFDSCFNTRLHNASFSLSPGSLNNSMNLSTTPRNFTLVLGPGKEAQVWLNVTANGCSQSSEFFDIDFDTFP